MTKNSPLKVRPSTETDASAILKIQQDTWLATYPNPELGITKEALLDLFESKGAIEEQIEAKREQTREAITNPQILECVVDYEGETVGWMVASIENEHTGRLKAIYILPQYQGKGIGRALMEKALEFMGNRDIYVNVASYNPTVHFYEKFGFKRTDTVISPDPEDKTVRAKIPEIEMVKK